MDLRRGAENRRRCRRRHEIDVQRKNFANARRNRAARPPAEKKLE